VADNGDPKVQLRFSILVTILGMLIAGATSSAATIISLKSDIKDTLAMANQNTLLMIDRHTAGGPHPAAASKESVTELRGSIGVLDDKVDKLLVDVAELRARERSPKR
jgi:hypothetical protein